MKQTTHLGLFIRKARFQRKMTQRELAKRLGCTSQFVANWERGISRPPNPLLPKIQEALNIPDQDFLTFLVKESLIRYKELFKK